MNTRRKFLLQGSMATTALLTANSLNSFAGITSPLTGMGTRSNRLLFLHTAGTQVAGAAREISDLKSSHGNAMLLHTGNAAPEQVASLKYDAATAEHPTMAFVKDYKVVYKGKFKIGLVNADNASIEEINNTASFLKQDKNCNLVVCLSSLGYKNNNGNDDVTLAGKSKSIDMILGGHLTNYSSQPMVLMNADKSQVVINHAGNGEELFGRIDFIFDAAGSWQQIEIFIPKDDPFKPYMA